MSTTPAFNTSVKEFPANEDHPAFTSTTVRHKVGTLTVSGFEDAKGHVHAVGYVHHANGVSFTTGVTSEGEPVVVMHIAGEVSIQITIFGVELADVLAAGAAAMEVQS